MPDDDLPDDNHLRLVVSGGGAKGVMYAGAYDALTNTGLIDKITEVSGASAGAICAAFIAIGMPVEAFREVLLETNLDSLKGERIPGAIITRDGAPMLALLKKQILNTVKKFLDENVLTISDTSLDNVNQIKNKLNDPAAAVTFNDLNTLQQAFPRHFKNLTVTAVKHPDGQLQVFNHELTPDVDIALACRASASIPILFEPVTIHVDNKDQAFVDGGLFDNLPSDYFDKDDKNDFVKNDKQNKTIILAFGEGLDDHKNPVFQALNSHLIPKAFLELLLEEAVNDDDEKTDLSRKNKIDAILTRYTENGMIIKKEADSIRYAVNQLKKQSISKMSIDELSKKIDDILSPKKLYTASYFQQFLRNTLVAWFSGFGGKYKNTDRKEVGFQKIRTDYREQTIELRVGTIKTTDFKPAQKLARELIAIGYLDTMDYAFRKSLTTDDPNAFYSSVLEEFKRIHIALLLASKKNPETDKLLCEISADQKQNKSARDIVSERIKPYAEKNMHSGVAFSLSRAVELETGRLDEKQLLIETHAKSRDQQWVSRTHFDSKNADELMKQFKDKMDGIKNNNDPVSKRSEIIADALWSPNKPGGFSSE